MASRRSDWWKGYGRTLPGNAVLSLALNEQNSALEVELEQNGVSLQEAKDRERTMAQEMSDLREEMERLVP